MPDPACGVYGPDCPEAGIPHLHKAPETGPAVTYQGVIALEWPPPRPRCGPMPGWGLSVFDALNGRQILTVTQVEVHVSASGLVTADVTMFADADGQPVFQLERATDPETGRWHEKIPAVGDDGRPREGTFPFLVAEMRVRQPEPERAALEPAFLAPEPCAD